ncbi:MAG: type II secretion system protein GspM [Thermodesulfobacteriota bacterium]
MNGRITSLGEKRSFFKRKTIGILLSLIGVVGIYVWGIVPWIEAKKKMEEEIKMKQHLILKYQEYINGRKYLEEDLKILKGRLVNTKKRLIEGETPQLASANLQEIIKRIATSKDVQIRSFRILEPKDLNYFRKISIQIDFNPTPSLLNLVQFLNEIENHEKMLVVSEMDLLVFNIRMPNNIQGNLIISGWMGKEKPKEGEKR